VYEEKMTGWPHDTSLQKSISDKENMEAVYTNLNLLKVRLSDNIM